MKKHILIIAALLGVMAAYTQQIYFSVSQHDSVKLVVNAESITVLAKKDPAATLLWPDSLVQVQLLITFSDSTDNWGGMTAQKPIIEIGNNILISVAPRSGDVRIPKRQLLFTTFTPMFEFKKQTGDWHIFKLRLLATEQKIFAGIRTKNIQPELLAVQ